MDKVQNKIPKIQIKPKFRQIKQIIKNLSKL